MWFFHLGNSLHYFDGGLSEGDNHWDAMDKGNVDEGEIFQSDEGMQ